MRWSARVLNFLLQRRCSHLITYKLWLSPTQALS